MLPAFVFRWMKESSATGFLRFGREPNRRVQDGEKRYWLCRDCETLLCQWETQFATQVFHPLIADGGQRIRYGDWMLKYCVSVSWRVLSMFVEDGQLDHFSDRQRASVALALKKWSAFLLGDEPHPGTYEQHFLSLDSVASFTGGEMPANINRYLLRVVDLDLGNGGAIVYSKFAKFILVGFIDIPYPKQWVGTKVHVREGHVGQGNVVLPKGFRDFLFAKCRRYAEVKELISENQQAKIAASMKDLDKVAASESFKALQNDVELFGDKAFRRVKPADER